MSRSGDFRGDDDRHFTPARARGVMNIGLRGVARILGKGVLIICARSARANFGHAHSRNGKVEVQTITENAFWR